ncbi:MAG TPA: Rrf2 family transcriptional regulator [Longimicrobiaceae bacterium]|nr:Rrf2 family transcriptional regulator [Longimicrobiaceae bacterium]
MSTMSSRVAVAVHVLAFLTWRREEAVSSQQIARSVNTNPVVVRRIVGALRRAGLVEVQPGAAGGARLARAPEEITLLEVYRSVEDGQPLFALHSQQPCRECGVGANIQAALTEVFSEAQAAMEAVLARVTVAEVWESVFARMGHPGPCGAEGRRTA